MTDSLNTILSYGWVNWILDNEYVGYLYGLTSTQLWIILLLAATLILLMIYRAYGPVAFLGVLFLFGFIYILNTMDIYNFYMDQEEKTKAHYEEIEKGMIKQQQLVEQQKLGE